MYKVYDDWPFLARKFSEMNYEKIDFIGIDHIIFVGMGGSGAIGDALASVLSKTDMHLSIVKGYHLPKTADSNTLVIASSASGNTIETFTVLKNAIKTGCKTIAFSSGGKIEKYCLKNNLEYRKVPIFNSPRASFPVYLYSILNVLEELIPIEKVDVEESLNLLSITQKQISSLNFINNPSMELAKWLLHGIPIIYYPMGLQAAAIRFKNSLQENVKKHALAEDIIEACHNGIVAWEKPSNVCPILIQGKDDYIKTKELWKIIKEYLKQNGIEYREIFSVKGGILSKIVNLVYLLDYSTIYGAVMAKLDPTPIKSIEFVKKRQMN